MRLLALSGRREAALDGNGIRVLTRLHALDGDPARQPLKAELWRPASEELGEAFRAKLPR